MSRTITTEAARYYKNGTGGVSSVVGYESSSNRVARYKFTAPSTGAYSVAVSIKSVSLGGGDRNTAIRFFITTSDSDHANAGAAAAYHGTLAITLANGTYTATGSARIILQPNQVYYLWVFPGSTSYGWWYWNSPAVLTVEEGAGLVYISNGSRYVPTIPYIYNGTAWVQAMPYIFLNGAWVLCS